MIKAELDLEITKFNARLHEAEERAKASAMNIRRDTTQSGEATGAGLANGLMGGLVRRLGPAAVAVGVGAAIKSAVDAAMADEAVKIRFDVLVGDSSAATELLQQLRDLSARTPLRFADVAEAGQKLVAFGEDVTIIPDTLRRIGDVSSGVGAGISEIAEIYGKARVQGTLFAEDINQLTGRGIPVIQEFARILGVSEQEVKKLASQGMITFPALAAAFQNLTNEGGKFAGMMDRLSGSTGGKISTLGDEWSMMKAEVGKGFNELAVAPLTDFLTSSLHAIRKFAGTVREEVATKADGPSQADLEAEARAAMEAANADKLAKEAETKRAQDEKDKERAGSVLRGLADQRRSMRRQDIGQLPESERLTAFAGELDQVFERMQTKGGAFFEPTLQGLEAWADKAAEIAAKTNDTTAAAESVKLLAEARGIMAEMDRVSAKLRADAVREAEDMQAKVESLRSATDKNRLQMASPEERANQARQQLGKSLGVNITSALDVESGLKRLQDEADKAKQSGNLAGERAALERLKEAQDQAKALADAGSGTGSRTATTPGSVAGAVNQIFGRSANELLLDETRSQTQELKKINTVLTTIKEKLPGAFGADDEFTFPY